MTTNIRYWCGDCERSWVRKVEWEGHFSTKHVKEEEGRGGKDIPNQCWNRKRKILGKEKDHKIQIRHLAYIFSLPDINTSIHFIIESFDNLSHFFHVLKTDTLWSELVC